MTFTPDEQAELFEIVKELLEEPRMVAGNGYGSVAFRLKTMAPPCRFDSDAREWKEILKHKKKGKAHD